MSLKLRVDRATLAEAANWVGAAIRWLLTMAREALS